MGKIITFGTLKGGVGKTMLCFNIGGILSQLGYRVLVIDSDLQGNLTNNMGIDRTQPDLLTTYDVYNLEEAQPEPDQLVIKSPIDRLPLLDMIAGSIFLHKSELKIASVAGREQILSNYLSDHKAFFDQYDYILIDCPPSLELLTVNALCAAGSLLVPVQCEYYALEGLSDLLATVRLVKRGLNPKLAMEGVLLTMFDSRTNLSLQVAEEVKRHFPGQVYATVIPRNVRLSEAPSHGMPVLDYDSLSRGAEAYRSLAEEIAAKHTASN